MNTSASGGSSRPAAADDDDENENDDGDRGESWFAGGERRSCLASFIYMRAILILS